MVSWRQRVRSLEEQLEILIEQKALQKEIIDKQQKKIEELERRLLAYENAHTPPSKKRKRIKREPGNGKLGAEKGHPRWERSDPEPTMSVEYAEDVCPDCDSKLGNPVKTERVLEEEIPEPQPLEVTEHLVNHYCCPGCGKHVVARNEAPSGRFGKNVLAHVALLKYDDRLPLRKAVGSLNRHYGLRLTNVSIMNITNKVAKKLEKPHAQLIKKVRKAKTVYADETEIRINGSTYWLWTFVTSTETVFVIRKSRAKKIVQEILGPAFKGVICCDGWMAYSQYTNNLQRCWAHILREAKQLADNHEDFTGFYTALKGMYAQILKIKTKPPPAAKRQPLRERLETELTQLLDQLNPYTKYKHFTKKLRNGFQHWFTCITNPEVEPTNNTAERALRELVVQRKIIGGLRREKGAKTMEVITSIIATLKQRQQPVFTTIKACL